MTNQQDDARIAATVENWKRKLLDLTKRNRALNFRVSKTSTISIVDEMPSEVFRELYLDERKMRFKAAPGVGLKVREPQPPQIDLSNDLVADDEEETTESLDFVPYDATSADERHVDEWLQTSAAPDALDKSLRRIDEQARLALDEQGVNTLFLALGMLHYTESKDSAVIFRAPLVLLPVELTRTSARAGFVIQATDDDPIVNPALVEYLRAEYGIALPEIPDSGVMPEDYDLQIFLTEASSAIRARDTWSIKTDMYLGLFSFQKFVMYKDMVANMTALSGHRLVRQLITRRAERGDQIVGLPTDIRSMNLDIDYPPESTAQVVDADSSQLRAIAATAKGHDLVIEGPPGTGKSQTITNLIARALSDGQSVLFVAEKMAALQVVHRRLVNAGLGEFCLELHSAKANKRAVVQELAAALNASMNGVACRTTATERLPQVRSSLTEYAGAVHTPHGLLAVSPYYAFGEFDRVINAPRFTYSGLADSAVTRPKFDETLRHLRDLAAASAGIGVPDDHPWRDSSRTFYTSDLLDDVRDAAAELGSTLKDVVARAEHVRNTFSLPAITTFKDVDTAVAVAEVMHRSPGAPLSVLRSDVWNAPPAAATRLIEQGKAVKKDAVQFPHESVRKRKPRTDAAQSVFKRSNVARHLGHVVERNARSVISLEQQEIRQRRLGALDLGRKHSFLTYICVQKELCVRQQGRYAIESPKCDQGPVQTLTERVINVQGRIWRQRRRDKGAHFLLAHGRNHEIPPYGATIHLADSLFEVLN